MFLLQAMRGRLAEDPYIQTITDPAGQEARGLVLRLFFQDGRPGAPLGQCRLIAWNEQADALSRYAEGDEIEFVGRLNSNQIGSDAGMSFTLVRLDESKTLVSAMEQFLMEFRPRKMTLAAQIQSAEAQKEAASHADVDHQKEATP